MTLPSTLACVLVLLLGTTARAQPSQARERRERTVTVTGNPADPPHELHVARGIATFILLDAPIQRAGIEVDRARVTIVDVGERSIVIEPVIEPADTEHVVLRVPFTDGKAPAQAVFVLVASPSEVDTRIDVIRREQTVEACQANLAEAQARCSKISPVPFARAGWLTREGVIAHTIGQCLSELRTARGLVCMNGTAYRAKKWALLDVTIRNEPDQPPWVPSEVTIKGMAPEVPVTVRAVELEAARIAPGEEGRVFVELEPPNAGELFVLELRDAAGRVIAIPLVNLSAQEGKR